MHVIFFLVNNLHLISSIAKPRLTERKTNMTTKLSMFRLNITNYLILSIFYSLSLINKTGAFPLEWKKTKVVPVHKKGDKQYLKNDRPVSLLPISGKTDLIFSN